MGRTVAYLRVDQIFSLYFYRFIGDARRYALYGVLLLPSNRTMEFLNPCVVPFDFAGELPVVVVCRILFGLCDQSSDVSVSYMAPIRARSSTNYRFGYFGSNLAQNGYVRICTFL